MKCSTKVDRWFVLLMTLAFALQCCRRSEQNAGLGQKAALLNVMDVPSVDLFAPFDSRLGYGGEDTGTQFIKPFKLRDTKILKDIYTGLISKPGYAALQNRIAADSSMILSNYTSSAHLMVLAPPFSMLRHDYACVGFFGGTKGVVYWCYLDSVDVEIGELDSSTIHNAEIVMSIRPHSVVEHSTPGNELAFVAFVTPEGRYACVSELFGNYASNELYMKLTDQQFRERQYMYNILWGFIRASNSVVIH